MVWAMFAIRHSKKEVCGSALRYKTLIFFDVIQLHCSVMKGPCCRPSCNVLNDIPASQEIYNFILPSAIQILATVLSLF